MHHSDVTAWHHLHSMTRGVIVIIITPMTPITPILILWRLGYGLRALNTLSQVAGYRNCSLVHSYYSGDLKSNHLKSGLFECWISNGPVLKWLGLSHAYSYKPNHSKFGCFCLDSRWFLTKWRMFVRISNGWASRFQISFKIWTICNLTSFQPFKIQTNLDFRSPLDK